jgi:hypothetical protein
MLRMDFSDEAKAVVRGALGSLLERYGVPMRADLRAGEKPERRVGGRPAV